MKEILLTEAAYEYLVKHLVEFEERKNNLPEEVLPRQIKERQEFEILLEKYFHQAGELAKEVKKVSATDNELPFVIIGCEVEIQNLSNNMTYQYRLIAPYESRVKSGDISYLSPVGKSLLLKRIGEVIEVQAPAGVFLYEVRSIRLQC